jgi:indolepyruvate ferredoxin oxidoreductase alpha subunit
MTGAQGNPVNGVTLTEQAAGASPLTPLDHPAGKALDLVKLCEAIGVDEVIQVDAQQGWSVRSALEEAISHTDKLSVIIVASPCRLLDRSRGTLRTVIDCRGCASCMLIAVPPLVVLLKVPPRSIKPSVSAVTNAVRPARLPA